MHWSGKGEAKNEYCECLVAARTARSLSPVEDSPRRVGTPVPFHISVTEAPEVTCCRLHRA